MTDIELLRQYAANCSDEEFRLVVQRHVGLFRGTALRQLGNDHHAGEVSHAVFMALARKASSLKGGTGWLFRTTRFVMHFACGTAQSAQQGIHFSGKLLVGQSE